MEETRVIIDENPKDGNPVVASPAASKGEYPTLIGYALKQPNQLTYNA